MIWFKIKQNSCHCIQLIFLQIFKKILNASDFIPNMIKVFIQVTVFMLNL